MMAIRKAGRMARSVFLILCGTGTISFAYLYLTVDFSLSRMEYPTCLTFTDSQGVPLRSVPDTHGERSQWISLENIPILLQQAFIAAEDKRFHDHPGIDGLAICRALLTNLKAGRRVSGASTITQQFVRFLYPEPRSYKTKVREWVRALKAEQQLSKETILENYLNRVPMGNNLLGVGKAAEVYFGKTVDLLTPSECALLASLPQAPSLMNLYRPANTRLETRRKWILERMHELGYLDSGPYEEAMHATLFVQKKRFPFESPHLINRLLKQDQPIPNRSSRPEQIIETTLDLSLQQKVEQVLLSHRPRLADLGISQAAALVVRNQDLSVLAYAGSIEYTSAHQGYNDGIRAKRSPGSTLKPFLYALALERGYPTSYLLDDTERRYRSRMGEYIPLNYTRQSYGPITLRSALANSLNLSAVRMTWTLGIQSFYEFLQELHLEDPHGRGPDWFGLGLAIGNNEVSLEDLVTAYALFPNRGVYQPLRFLKNQRLDDSRRIISEDSAFIISDILADPSARMLTFGTYQPLTFPYQVAWKTGTSTHYRDNWIVGFTSDYTVGIWTGNFDGARTQRSAGAIGAGPIFSDIIRYLHRSARPAAFLPPESLISLEVCGYSGKRPTSYCPHRCHEWFRKGAEPREMCTFHANQGDHHELPMVFASWLYKRSQHGITSAYRIPHLAEQDQRVQPAAISSTVTSATSMLPSPPDNQGKISINRPHLDASIQTPNSQINIIYPLDGQEFFIDRIQNKSSIRLVAEVSQYVEEVIWYVNGQEISRSPAPYQTQWQLTRGEHIISANSSSGGYGSRVRIHVQ